MSRCSRRLNPGFWSHRQMVAAFSSEEVQNPAYRRRLHFSVCQYLLFTVLLAAFEKQLKLWYTDPGFYSVGFNTSSLPGGDFMFFVFSIFASGSFTSHVSTSRSFWWRSFDWFRADIVFHLGTPFKIQCEYAEFFRNAPHLRNYQGFKLPACRKLSRHYWRGSRNNSNIAKKSDRIKFLLQSRLSQCKYIG